MIYCSSGVGTSEERPLYSVAQLAETLFAALQPQFPVRRQRYAARALLSRSERRSLRDVPSSPLVQSTVAVCQKVLLLFTRVIAVVASPCDTASETASVTEP